MAIVLLLLLAVLPVMASDPVLISQKGRTFKPGSIEVPVGTTVRMINDDRYVHHAYIKHPDLKFDAGEIDTGGYTEVTIPTVGTFIVRCAIHPKMRLTITAK